EWGLQHRFVVSYSGNLGRAHDSETILSAIAQIERIPVLNPPITWLFIGGGSLYDSLQTEVKRLGLKSVQFRPYQSREQLSQSLSAADLHLISLRPELEGLIVPSKFYGILAAGRASIFIGDPNSEIARTLAHTE